MDSRRNQTRFAHLLPCHFALAALVLATVVLAQAGCGPTPEQSQEANRAPADSSDRTADEGVEPKSASTVPESPADRATQSETVAPPVDTAGFLEASLAGELETVQAAIEAGMDVAATDEQQRTALLLAAFNGHTPVIKLLLEHGALVEHRDAVGRTALMYAATGANGKTVRWLLENGAEPNAVDTGEGFTALMHAAAEGQLEVVTILLQHNADSTVTDVDGDTASDFATRNGHTEIVQLLTRAPGGNQ
jgi:ankyrin repeat protein